MMKVGDRVEMIPGNIFEHQSNVPGTVINIDEGDLYPIVVKWDNGKQYCYTEKHIRLIAKFRVGDEVMIAPTSEYYGQFSGAGVISKINEEPEYIYYVKTEGGYENNYREIDLLPYVKPTRIHAMYEIANDPTLVTLLTKWIDGPIAECPFAYGHVKRNCHELCYKLFPGTAPGCPCMEPDRKEIVTTILQMAKFSDIKVKKSFDVGAVFSDNEGELFVLMTIGDGNARLIALDGSGYWGDAVKNDGGKIVFPDDFLEGLTYKGQITELTIINGKM